MYQEQDSSPIQNDVVPAPTSVEKKSEPRPLDKNGQTWVDEVCFMSWFEGKHVTWD